MSIRKDTPNPLVSAGEIVLYQPEGEVKLEVRVENETVWLTQAQMAELFQKNQSVIARHIQNAISEREITKEGNMQILHNTLSKYKPTTIYSLDVIISVGYRVKSARRSIVFIDPYADISALKFTAMKAEGVAATIYSARISHQFKEEAALYKKQHPEFDLKTMRVIHDRFLLVDDTVYHFGASFKDMGAEFSAYSVLNFVTPEEVIEKVMQTTKESSAKGF